MQDNLAKKDNFTVVRDLLEKSKEEIAKALPKNITPERVARIALTTLRKNPGLLECDPRSFLGAVMQASQLGFELDDNLGLAYLVPYKNRKTGEKEAQLVIGYRGLIELARRSGKLKNISARIVYENEPFSIAYGLSENLAHTPLPPSQRGNNIKGAYAVATMNDGSKTFEFLWGEELNAIKKAALEKAWNPKISPWETHWEEMYKKTAIRKMMKYMPLSPEATKATVIDEYGESDHAINTKDIFLQPQPQAQDAALGMREPKPIAQMPDANVPLAEKTQSLDTQATTPITESVTENENMTETVMENKEEEVPAWVNDEYLGEEQDNKTQSKPQEPVKKTTADCISDKQISFVNNLCKKKGISEDQMAEMLKTVFGEEINLESLTKKEATILIDYIKEIA